MRTSFLLTLFVVMGAFWCRAQDIAPSEQARGYLESKNVTVDYTTGIFHYSVPLFELKSGDYTLPVSLNYTGGGVKYESHAGIVGYNWNLSCGGVLTRTIRGGIADEIYGAGLANPSSALPALTEEVKRVNKHQRDGESDVFTAVFNGRSVRFVLKNKGTDSFSIEPLERTDVKISYRFSIDRFEEWRLTDEQGVCYVYDVPEWSCNYSRQEAAGTNSIVDKSYISSWYLSRIEIPNADTLRFHYDHRFGGNGKDTRENGGNVMHCFENTHLTYHYGIPLSERPFDFSKYRTKFEEYLESARSYISQSQLLNQVNTSMYVFSDYEHAYVLNRDYFHSMSSYRLNEQILGILGEFSGVTSASQELVEALEQLINATGSEMGRTYLGYAKNCLISCLDEERRVSRKTASSNAAYRVFPPVLTSVSTPARTLVFHHSLHTSANFYMLDSLTLLDHALQAEQRVVLKNPGDLLYGLSWKDACGKVWQQQGFTYHLENLSCTAMNEWGDYDFDPESEEEYHADVCYRKQNSLQSISLPTGGKIWVDYEINRYRSPRWNSDLPYGGVRVKTLVFEYPSREADTVYYRYPYAGVTVYTDIDNAEYLHYGSFQDTVYSSRMICKGNFLYAGGNNGLYYPYVEEEFTGKGKNTYLFSVPSLHFSSLSAGRPFWLHGLLLGKAVYDQSGRLLRMQKNKYYADLSHALEDGAASWPFSLADWCTSPPSGFSYSKSLSQIKANGYYLDGEELDEHYRNQPLLFLYADNGHSVYLNPYVQYQVNLQPRTCLQLDQQDYSVCYGGKVVLKEQQEYVFHDAVTTGASITHFTGSLPAGASLPDRVEYVYDRSSLHCRPTRLIRHLVNGDEQITMRQGVLDFTDGAHPMVARLKERNLVAPVLREQLLLKKAGSATACLQQEDIHLYGLQAQNDVMLPYATLRYRPSAAGSSFTFKTEPDDCLFSVDSSLYRKEQEIRYEWSGKRYLPEQIVSMSEKEGMIFDRGRGNMIVRASSVEASALAAADGYRYARCEEAWGDRLSLYFALQQNVPCFRKFVEVHNGLVLSDYSEEFRFYFESEGFRRLMEFAGQVGNDPSDTTWLSRKEQISADLREYQNMPVRAELYAIYPREQQDDFIRAGQVFLSLEADFPVETLQYEMDKGVVGAGQPSVLEVMPEAGCTGYKAFYVVCSSRATVFSPSYSFVQDGETVFCPSESTSLQAGKWQVVCRSIDLQSGALVSKVSASIPWGVECALVVLAPSDVTFEAISADLSERPFCKLTNQGRLERYEYDAAGRLVRTYDENGFLLKESDYKTASEGTF